VTDAATQNEGAVRPSRPLVSRRVSPVLFAVILFAFALPFGTVSCEGPPVKFTGYQLATWQVPETTPPATTDDGKNLKDAVESRASFWALLTLGAAVAGALLGVGGRRGGGIAASVGLAGVLMLFIATEPLSFDGPDVKFEDGFALTALLYCVLAVWHAIVSIRRRSGSDALDSAVTTHAGSPVR
jgi:hypothetical protein